MGDSTEGRARASARPLLTMLCVAATCLAVAVVATAADGWPLPRAFDEFSYLLAGETFASGRLTNPAYPFPEAVETIHVLQAPTYSSKYLPGHGLFLALGMALGGGARLGQWLAFAVMGAAIYWMTIAWLSRRGAILTTALFILAIADLDWVSGFWGSSLAVAGSALLFGSLRRLEHGPRVHLGALAGLGAIMLGLTRPLEGLAVSVIPAAYMLWWMLRSSDRRRRLLVVGVPAAVVLALGGVFLAAHNSATTGDPLELAYSRYEEGAPGAPPFIWQPVQQASGVLRANEQARLGIDLGSYNGMRQNWRAAMYSRVNSMTAQIYFPHVAFAAVFLLLPFALRDRRLWLLAVPAAFVALAVGTSSFYLPHYVGPALPPLLVLYAACFALLLRLKRGQLVGRAAAGMAVLALAAMYTWRIFAHTPLERGSQNSGYWTRQRQAMADQLDSLPGRDVVFVRYAPNYKSQNEWVQNGADLDNTSVLWVHDLGERANAALQRYEADRRAWLVTVHGVPDQPVLTPYESRAIPMALGGSSTQLLPGDSAGRARKRR